MSLLFKQLKIGDVVRIKDTQNIRGWLKGAEAIGKEFEITADDMLCFKHNTTCTLGNNCYGINYFQEDLELVNCDWDK
jgi:hypothetical protein